MYGYINSKTDRHPTKTSATLERRADDDGFVLTIHHPAGLGAVETTTHEFTGYFALDDALIAFREVAGDAPAVHFFSGSGAAYDCTQMLDGIKDGDVIAIESERVAGFLFQAWPVAVTEECGKLHTPTNPDQLSWDERYRASWSWALELAAQWNGEDVY